MGNFRASGVGSAVFFLSEGFVGWKGLYSRVESVQLEKLLVLGSVPAVTGVGMIFSG